MLGERCIEQMMWGLVTLAMWVAGEYTPSNNSYAPVAACALSGDKIGCVIEQISEGNEDAYYLEVDPFEATDVGCGNNTLVTDYSTRSAISTDDHSKFLYSPPNIVFVTGMAEGDKANCNVKAYVGAVVAGECPVDSASALTVDLADMTNSKDATSFRLAPLNPSDTGVKKLIVDASTCQSGQHFYIGYKFDKDTVPSEPDATPFNVLFASTALALTVAAFSL